MHENVHTKQRVHNARHTLGIVLLNVHRNENVYYGRGQRAGEGGGGRDERVKAQSQAPPGRPK